LPTSRALKNSCLAIGVGVGTLIIVLGMHVHEIIYYTVIQDISTGLSICVSNFNIASISNYNRISTLIHYLFPFCVQVASITLMIVLVARSRVKTVGKKMTFHQVLKKQFQTQKELYVTPVVIVLSALPQTILTFSFACTQLTNWQRHIFLGAYLLSYSPQVLSFFFHVLPSTSFKKEFGETAVGKKLSNWMLSKKVAEVIVLNTSKKART